MNTSRQSLVVSPTGRKERQTNFKVVIRVRPPLPRELSGESPFKNIVAVHSNEQAITVSENLEAVLDDHGDVLANHGPYSSHTYVFDHVYDQNSSQMKVYETTARSVVDSALQGYNATIFAYGQTGTGKTFTMEGFNSEGSSVEARGIIPRAIEQVFGHIQRHVSPRMKFLVRASYLQIYNEQISDLLKPDRSNLSIREDKKKGVYVEGLSEWVVRSPAEIYGLMERGGTLRATGETKMNEASSRSHAVFIVIAEQVETIYVDEQGAEMSADEFNKFMHAKGVRREEDMKLLEDHIRQSFKVGKLNLVDLAGSERVRLSGATGQRLEESKQINRSLSALGNVISALTEAKGRAHIPYRDSKLTRMLEDSLGGNCKTTMMAMLSPALEAIAETLSTLKFANRAKNIRNEAKVNEDLDQKSLLRKYERELKKLRAELEARSKNVVDKRRLLELDEQRKRAEADKMAAIRALELRSREFMQEKEEKKKLEQRINMLMSQMIRRDNSGAGMPNSAYGNGAGEGGGDPGAGPDMHVILKDQQERLRQEYEDKLADLERERETIVEEKAQVDRYKQLLLKQRDIMIALTQRLVERDEQIVSLQDELDAYDKHHRELEEKLDEKTAMLIKFQRISMEVNASSPYKNEELSRVMESWTDKNGIPALNIATEVLSDETERTIPPSPVVTEHNKRFNDFNTRPPLDNKRVERILQSEWAECLRRIREEDRKSNVSTSSATTGHMATMINDITSKLSQHFKSISHEMKSTHDSAEMENLIAENAKLNAKIRQLESENITSTMNSTKVLQDRCDTLLKERQAVNTIMEQKIKILVQSISQAVGVVVQNSSSGSSQTGHALVKDVAALERLVNASVAALRNASTISSMTPSSASSSSASVSSVTTSQTANDAPISRGVAASFSQQSSQAGIRQFDTGQFYKPPGTSSGTISGTSATSMSTAPIASKSIDTLVAGRPSRSAPPPPSPMGFNDTSDLSFRSQKSVPNAPLSSSLNFKAGASSFQPFPSNATSLDRPTPPSSVSSSFDKSEDSFNRIRNKYSQIASTSKPSI